MADHWRLLVSAGAPGARNMALDEALLTAGGDCHTLRLYWFDPAALSIGAFQPLAEVDLVACAHAGVDLVRRPTGGRAVLHDGGLTYALVGPEDGDVFSGGVLASYQRISRALLAACASLGVLDVQAAPVSARHVSGPSCFATPAPYEVLVGSHKLAGSAQARRAGRALQHGTLRLAEGRAPAAALLYPRRAGAPIPPDPPSLAALLGRALPRRTVVDALVAAFRSTFDVTLEPAALSAAEELEAQRLLTERYGAPEWTARR